MQRTTPIKQQDGVNQDDEIHPTSHENLAKSPTLLLGSSNKRDSGYGTDVNSPASQTSGTSAPSQFTYEDRLQEEFEEININAEADDMFIDSSGIVSNDIDEESDGDDTDKEVEDFLSDPVEQTHSVSQPISIQRPQAPIPTPEEDKDADNDVIFTVGENEMLDLNGVYDDDQISRPFHHNQWTRPRAATCRFRPIASRSFGTQTFTGDRARYVHSGRPIRPTSARGRGLERLRLRSESEMPDGSSPLPDVIQFPPGRDRSVSLPDVPSYAPSPEQEVGRELRRISDEFLSSFTPIQQRNGLPNSFPMRVNFDVQGAWNRLRRIVSSGSITPEVEEKPFKFPHPK
ncbi:hypothetical protein ACF0H5_003851 [Mactra antiquata]